VNFLRLRSETSLSARAVIRDWECQYGFAALAVIAVGELQYAAVGFSDLSAQDLLRCTQSARWD
jgi:hypothetical protein